MTEVPEHLLQRSRDRRRAMGLAVEGDDAPAAAPTESANAPAVAAAAAPAAKAPVPFPAAEPPPPPPPDSEWVANAKDRQKVPYWVMPVLLFLPIWLIMYVGTLEEPTREEGVLYEGRIVYEENCASCHGGSGAGGVGPAFTGGAIIEAFAAVEGQVAWVAQGTQVFQAAGRATYGDNSQPLAATGANMPAFAEDLTSAEIIAAVFYERVELGGFDEELLLAEAIWDKIDHEELEGLPEHFVEGPEGDLDGAEVVTLFAETRQALAGEGEVAAE